MTLFYPLIRTIASALTILMTFLTLGAGVGEVHQVKNEEELEAVFSVLSDCHVEGLDKEFTFTKTYGVLSRVIDDVNSLEGGNDAVVFLGDNTMNGQHIENLLFFGAAADLDTQKVFALAGNHDFSNGEGDYAEYKARYLAYNNAFFTDNLTEAYYYDVVNGCYIVCLASEDVTVNTMYLSDTQLEWLKEVLDKAQAENAPILVMSHHPADYLEGRDYNSLTDILNDYDNLLYFCGHTHREYGEGSVYTLDGVNCINLPKCTHKNESGTGIGAQVEVYGDEIVVRIRDFYNGSFVEGAEYTYEIR